MKRSLFLIGVFLLAFLSLPVKVAEYCGGGPGSLDELGICQKLIFFGGYKILSYLIQPVYAQIFKINSYSTFFGDLNPVGNVIYLCVVSAILTAALYFITSKLLKNFLK